MKLHNFKQDLEESKIIQEFDFWNDIYREFFGDNITIVSNPSDGQGQRLGVDRIIVSPGSSACIRIDEKIRKISPVTGRIYDDILLEFLSSKEHNKPGWVCKPLLADYIAYANLPAGICYMLPVQPLQKAWKVNGKRWRERKEIPVRNEGYTTMCTPVPVNELYPAMGKTLRIKFDPVK